jgi:Lipocalin-like domain
MLVACGSLIQEGQLMMDLVGTWRLTSAHLVRQATGDRVDLLGADPFGFVVFEPGGRMIVIMTSDARTRSKAAGDVAALLRSMIAYTGRYTVDGEKFVTKVDGAWDPSWVGTEQVRYFAFDGRTLSLRSTPLHHPSYPDEEVVAHVEWEKE